MAEKRTESLDPPFVNDNLYDNEHNSSVNVDKQIIADKQTSSRTNSEGTGVDNGFQNSNVIQDTGPQKLLSYRYALVMWGTLGFINLYFQRVNLSGKTVFIVMFVGNVQRNNVHPKITLSVLPYVADSMVSHMKAL